MHRSIDGIPCWCDGEEGHEQATILPIPDRLGSTNTILVGQADVEAVAMVLRANKVKGAFVFAGLGFWEGSTEEEEAVCIFVDGLTFPVVLTLCQALKVAFNQKAVLLRRDKEAFLV